MSVPEEIARREERIERIREAKQTIEERAERRYEEEQAGRKKPGPKPKPPENTGPEPKDQVNLTDEESRIMPTTGSGFQQAYNAQATVCMDSHLILEGHLSQRVNDKQELDPALQKMDRLPEKVGRPDRLAADNGYYSSDNVQGCEDREICPYISAGREKERTLLRAGEPA